MLQSSLKAYLYVNQTTIRSHKILRTKGRDTMKEYLEFSTAECGSIIIEGDDLRSEGGVELAAGGGRIVRKMEKSFEDTVDGIRTAAELLASKLSDLSETPDEVQIEFGIGMNGKAGAVIVAADIGANFKVTLKWRKQ